MGTCVTQSHWVACQSTVNKMSIRLSFIMSIQLCSKELRSGSVKRKFSPKLFAILTGIGTKLGKKIPPNQQRTDGFKFVARNLGDSPAYFDLHNSTRLLVFHWKKAL